MEKRYQSELAATWEAIKRNPEPVKGLRKLKARNMLTAMQQGIFIKGNAGIMYRDDCFTFTYRGTPLLAWYVKEMRRVPLDAGRYEATMSTINQRREINLAIDNFKEVFGL